MTLRKAALAALVFATQAAMAEDFRLESPQLRQGALMDIKQVFKGFGCEGGNVSPALRWKNAPSGTKSFAVTAYDPDAPTGSGWWHWVIFNIPASVDQLALGAGNPASELAPLGAVQSRTDFGAPGYGGPCPPVGHGAHHYRFTVYALKLEKLPLDQQASGALVGYFLNQNALGKATIEAIYRRD